MGRGLHQRLLSVAPVTQTASLGCFLGHSPQLVSLGKTNSIITEESSIAGSMALELSPSKIAVRSQRTPCHSVRASMAEGILGKKRSLSRQIGTSRVPN